MKQITVGEQLENYIVLGELGKGGMSRVYRARDETSGDTVVIKVPHEEMMGDFATFERFQREVEIGKRLQHPHIQRALSSGKDATFPYVVMEYVDGRMLRDLLDERAPLAVEEALDLTRQLCEALIYCHANGIFHRDLKPENMIVSLDGHLKLMDFGIALLQGARRVTWKRLSAQFGTPDYMSPEQIQGDRGDARSDIYALGIMLFEMLTGRVPYRGDHPLAVMNQHVNGTPPLLRDLNAKISPALQEVVLKCIRRSPANRYNDVATLAKELSHLDEVDVEGLALERGAQPIKKNSTPEESGFWIDLGLAPGTSPLKVCLIILGCLILVAAFGFLAQFIQHLHR